MGCLFSSKRVVPSPHVDPVEDQDGFSGVSLREEDSVILARANIQEVVVVGTEGENRHGGGGDASLCLDLTSGERRGLNTAPTPDLGLSSPSSLPNVSTSTTSSKSVRFNFNRVSRVSPICEERRDCQDSPVPQNIHSAVGVSVNHLAPTRSSTSPVTRGSPEVMPAVESEARVYLPVKRMKELLPTRGDGDAFDADEESPAKKQEKRYPESPVDVLFDTIAEESEGEEDSDETEGDLVSGSSSLTPNLDKSGDGSGEFQDVGVTDGTEHLADAVRNLADAVRVLAGVVKPPAGSAEDVNVDVPANVIADAVQVPATNVEASAVALDVSSKSKIIPSLNVDAPAYDAVENPVYVDVSSPTKMERSDGVDGGKEAHSNCGASPVYELLDGAARGTNRSMSKDSPKFVEDGARLDSRESVDVELHDSEPMEGEAIYVDRIEEGAAEDIHKLVSDEAISVPSPLAGIEYDVSESADGAATVLVDRFDNAATATSKEDAVKQTDAYTGDAVSPAAEFLDPAASQVTDIQNGDMAYCGIESNRVAKYVNKEVANIVRERSGAGDGWSQQANGDTHCERAIHAVDQDLRSFSEDLVQDLIDKAVLFL